MPIPRLSSRISAVTVYRTGAVITRIADLPADATAQVAIAGLPLCLEDVSLRVRVEGAAAIAGDATVAVIGRLSRTMAMTGLCWPK